MTQRFILLAVGRGRDHHAGGGVRPAAVYVESRPRRAQQQPVAIGAVGVYHRARNPRPRRDRSARPVEGHHGRFEHAAGRGPGTGAAAIAGSARGAVRAPSPGTPDPGGPRARPAPWRHDGLRKNATSSTGRRLSGDLDGGRDRAGERVPAGDPKPGARRAVAARRGPAPVAPATPERDARHEGSAAKKGLPSSSAIAKDQSRTLPECGCIAGSVGCV